MGEGAIAGREASIAAANPELEHYIVGKDLTVIEFLWQAMYRWPRWRAGGGPILNSAVNAIEFVLWDISGKTLDVPIYRLLGGAARQIEAMHQPGSDDFDIMTDAHGKFNPSMVLEYAQAIEPYRIMFLEEPIQVEDADLLEWLGRHTNISLAMGERQFTKFGFKEMIFRHLVSYVQPDVVHAGGILETKKCSYGRSLLHRCCTS